jgi:hypothetical protein
MALPVLENYTRALAITTSDTVNFTDVADAIYVGVSGVVVAVGADGVAVTFTGAPVGVLPFRAKRVNATSTTATNMVALYQS